MSFPQKVRSFTSKNSRIIIITLAIAYAVMGFVWGWTFLKREYLLNWEFGKLVDTMYNFDLSVCLVTLVLFLLNFLTRQRSFSVILLWSYLIIPFAFSLGAVYRRSTALESTINAIPTSEVVLYYLKALHVNYIEIEIALAVLFVALFSQFMWIRRRENIEALDIEKPAN